MLIFTQKVPYFIFNNFAEETFIENNLKTFPIQEFYYAKSKFRQFTATFKKQS